MAADDGMSDPANKFIKVSRVCKLSNLDHENNLYLYHSIKLFLQIMADLDQNFWESQNYILKIYIFNIIVTRSMKLNKLHYLSDCPSFFHILKLIK